MADRLRGRSGPDGLISSRSRGTTEAPLRWTGTTLPKITGQTQATGPEPDGRYAAGAAGLNYVRGVLMNAPAVLGSERV